MADSGEVKTYSMMDWLDAWTASPHRYRSYPHRCLLTTRSFPHAPCSWLFAPCSLLFAPCSPCSPLLLTTSPQVLWSKQVLARGSRAEAGMARVLGLLANCVLQEQPPLGRKKIENLIGEYVHKRSVLRLLINIKVVSNKDFDCLWQIHFYYELQGLQVDQTIIS